MGAERRIHVSWGDCDASGIVFYPRYYAWFDACTHALLEGLGLGHHALRRDHGALGLTLVHAAADFRSPATYGDVLGATSRVARVGTSSLTVAHLLALGERVVVEGSEIRVWAIAGAGGGIEAAPFPAAVRERLTTACSP